MQNLIFGQVLSLSKPGLKGMRLTIATLMHRN